MQRLRTANDGLATGRSVLGRGFSLRPPCDFMSAVETFSRQDFSVLSIVFCCVLFCVVEAGI